MPTPPRIVKALLVGDIHLSQNPPLCRAGEPDWFEAMARPLVELKTAQSLYGVPVIIAGDIFDRWNPPPELINFALENLPDDVHAIPGQHDLPNHNYEEMNRSAYGVLVSAGKIHDLTPTEICSGYGHNVNGIEIYAFPWGFPIEPVDESDDSRFITLALVHAYIWQGKLTGYTGAPEDRLISEYASKLHGFTHAVFGDNHIPFDGRIDFAKPGISGFCRVYNCGGFYRRKSDEVDHRPSYGLLYSTGEIERVYFDCSADVLDITKTETKVDLKTDFQEFTRELAKLSGGAFDFRFAVKTYCETHDVTPAAKKWLSLAMDEK